MLVVETIAKVRRAYFGQGRSIKAICGELGVSRKVVRKVLRSGATEFSCEREVQPKPKIGPIKDTLATLLAASDARPAYERLTAVRIFEEVREMGFTGGYDAIRRYVHDWREERSSATSAAFVPLSFAPGEAFQFDWSHEVVLINGSTVTVKVAHVRLCHSRMLFPRACPREMREMVFDAHDRAFAFLRGACTRGIYDDMKTAVDAVIVDKERAYNRRFLQMSGHCLVEPVGCTPASGWEKGQVENQVGLVRDRFFSPRLRVKSYEELNSWLLDQCIAYAKAHRHPEFRDQTVWEAFETERPCRAPYAGRLDGFHATPASVSKTCLVRFDNNRYSVMASAVGRPVEIGAYADRIELRQGPWPVLQHRRSGQQTRGRDPRRGARWDIGQLHKLLTSPTYKGEYRFNRKVWTTREDKPETEQVAVPVDPVIEPALFDALQAGLKARKQKTTPPRFVTGPVLLTGTVTCTSCGGG
jgi:transposase